MLENFKKILKNKGEVYLTVKARPGADRTTVKDIMDDEAIKIDIAAPAIKGKANEELVKFLAKEFEAAKNNIKIISGAGEKIKLVKIIK